MEVKPKEIREYLTSEGVSPFSDWIDSLKDKTARAKIRIRLDRLKLGNMGDCKSVGDGVSELRIDFGNGCRVYIGQDGDVLLLLLCGGTKKDAGGGHQKSQSILEGLQKEKTWTNCQDPIRMNC
ncbi:MAG: type II toxin-antitoxin system RelE/ParE family toxin [Desulfobacterales bacterium]